MSYGYSYSQPLAPTPSRARSPWPWLGPMLAVFAIVTFVAFGAVWRIFTTPDNDGVRLGNQLSRVTLADLDQKALVQPNETILAYYEVAASGDRSELTFVTSERLVYFKDGRTTAMRLADITDVKHHEESLIGDVIEARANDGQLIRIEVAPFNDGPVFLSVLEDARSRASSSKQR
jgi:hypothetical protein